MKVLAYASVNATNFSIVGESAETKERNKKLVQGASVSAQKGSVKASGQPKMNVLQGELQTRKKIAAEAQVKAFIYQKRSCLIGYDGNIRCSIISTCWFE